jgi:metal-sulfur cluster biosynthetic enzyme
VAIGLTDPTCMLLGSFANEARHRLADLPGVTGVEIKLDRELEWTPDRFAPHYQQRLAEHRAAVRARLRPVTPVTAGRKGNERRGTSLRDGERPSGRRSAADPQRPLS